MPVLTGRFAQLRWLQNVICVTAIIGSVILIGLGLLGWVSSGDGASAWLIVAGGFVLFVTVMLMTFTPILLKLESTAARQLSELRDLREAVAQQAATLGSISENTRISDAAKALAHREQELDALRVAIRDDLRGEKWEAALYLVDEIERRFGYKEEADRLREEVDDARNSAIQTKLHEAIEMIEGHFQSHDWDRAQHEMDRLGHALPDNARVLALRDRMQTLKEEHKQELKLSWDEAVRRDDTDRAIDILKGLDQYLSAVEVRELQASARNIFKEKLLQLGIQFRFAVKEKRWQDALTTGLELIRDFPNAQMANEVREALDTLRERARISDEAQPAHSEPKVSR